MILLDELRRVTEHGHGDRFAELGKRLGVVVEPDEFVAADGLGGLLVAHPENYPQPASGVKGA